LELGYGRDFHWRWARNSRLSANEFLCEYAVIEKCNAAREHFFSFQAPATKTFKFVLAAIIITGEDPYRIPYRSAADRTIHKLLER